MYANTLEKYHLMLDSGNDPQSCCLLSWKAALLISAGLELERDAVNENGLRQCRNLVAPNPNKPYFNLLQPSANYTAIGITLGGWSICLVTRPCDHFYAMAFRDVKLKITTPLAADVILEPKTLALSLKGALKMNSIHSVRDENGLAMTLSQEGHIMMQASLSFGFDIDKLGAVTLQLNGGILINADTNRRNAWDVERTLVAVDELQVTNETADSDRSVLGQKNLGFAVMTNAEVKPYLRLGKNYECDFSEVLRASSVFQLWSSASSPLRLTLSLRAEVKVPLKILEAVKEKDMMLSGLSSAIAWLRWMGVPLNVGAALQLDLYSNVYQVNSGSQSSMDINRLGLHLEFELPGHIFGLALNSVDTGVRNCVSWNGRELCHSGNCWSDWDCDIRTPYCMAQDARGNILNAAGFKGGICVQCEDDGDCRTGPHFSYCESPESIFYYSLIQFPSFRAFWQDEFQPCLDPDGLDRNGWLKRPERYSYTCRKMPVKQYVDPSKMCSRQRLHAIKLKEEEQQEYTVNDVKVCPAQDNQTVPARRRAQERAGLADDQETQASHSLSDYPRACSSFVSEYGGCIYVSFLIILLEQRTEESISPVHSLAIEYRLSILAGGAPAQVESEMLPTGSAAFAASVIFRCRNSEVNETSPEYFMGTMLDKQSSRLLLDLEAIFGEVAVVSTSHST